jgi:hypothetical protein
MIRTGINIALEWWSEDVAIGVISCSNGTFSGEARVYMNPDELRKLGEALNGFPKDGKDRREVELGAFEPSFAGGFVHLKFHCTDSAGPAVVDGSVRADNTSTGGPGCGEFSIPIEAAAVDRFVAELRRPRKDFASARLTART